MYMHVEHQLELAEFYIMCFKLCFIKNSKSLELVVNHSHNVTYIRVFDKRLAFLILRFEC